jgi:hypothetical protein
MPKPSKSKSQKPKVRKGQNAISSIIKNSTDQFRGAARNRYVKRGGLTQIAADINELRKMMNTEEKHTDTQTTATSTVLSSSTILLVNPPAEGSDNNQRTGRSIKVVKIDCNFQFLFSSGTVSTTGILNQLFNYYVIKYLKTPSSSGSVPFVINDLLNIDPNGNFSPLSFPNSDIIEDFAILASGQIDVELPETTTAPSYRNKAVTLSIDRSFHQSFNGTALTNITDNCVFVVFTALNPANTGGNSTVTSSVRLWYVDN